MSSTSATCDLNQGHDMYQFSWQFEQSFPAKDKITLLHLKHRILQAGNLGNGGGLKFRRLNSLSEGNLGEETCSNLRLQCYG